MAWHGTRKLLIPGNAPQKLMHITASLLLIYYFDFLPSWFLEIRGTVSDDVFFTSNNARINKISLHREEIYPPFLNFGLRNYFVSRISNQALAHGTFARKYRPQNAAGNN